jgi:hypothetical protein
VPQDAPTTLVGTFGAPTSDQWDPGAGEILYSTWLHESDHEGTSLQTCWPLSNPSPNMDIDPTPGVGTICDGVNDHPALPPDAQSVESTMPSDVAVTGAHSWEMQTQIRPAASGNYTMCTSGIDDGGYVALAPTGQPLTSADVVVDVKSYGDPDDTGVVTLDASTTYDVVIRVSNRGGAGVDSSAGPGGFGYFGLVPEGTACTPDSSAAFGTASGAGIESQPGPIDVLPAAAVRMTGTVTGGDGSFSQARVVNDGPDATTVNATVNGQIEPVPSVPLGPGEATVLGSFMTPGAPGVIGVNPWTISTTGTLAPQP